jgi:DNA (cytosine-5)-methyltransferase 1
MSLGFEQAGFEVVAAFDLEQIHVDTHKLNFPACRALRGDLSELSGTEIREQGKIGKRDIDVLFGGPPCQGFSLIGKRNASDPRNGLLLHFARLVRELEPKYFVMENVAGLTSGDAAKTLQAFINKARNAGYSVVEPVQVLDASDFGVPQRRRRVLVLGHRSDLPAPRYPKPLSATDKGYAPPTVWDAIGDLPNVDRCKYLLQTDVYRGTLSEATLYSSVLRGETPDPADKSRRKPRQQPGLSGCLRTKHSGSTISRFKSTPPGTSEAISRFYRLSKNGLSSTLRAGTGPSNGSFMAARPIHPTKPRCITVREAARLHSFPDWFQFHATKWHGFRQIGNSVPPLLARSVAASVADALARASTDI